MAPSVLVNTRLRIVTLGIAVWAGLLSAQAAEQARRPNIIVILADDKYH